MSEWWTYRPSDFLMFAPSTYWRLFELHNQAWWPAQPLLLLAGLAWMLGLGRAALRPQRAALWLRSGAAALAAIWAFVAGSFLWQRFEPINWAASTYAAGFLVQALGLLTLAAVADLHATTARARRRVGLLIVAAALLAYPLLTLAAGKPWTQAEVFGLAPDPTAIATLGFLLQVQARASAVGWLLRALWALALAWCALSAATLLTLGSAQGWVPLAAALAAGLACRVSR